MIKEIFFISECPNFDHLGATYELANCYCRCQKDTGLCNCPPEPHPLPIMWYVQYEGRTGPYCNTCRRPNPRSKITESAVIPGILDKEEYKHQLVCEVSK